MPYFDKIDISEGIDVNKTSESIECDICHYGYFLSFNFQRNVYSRCHDYIDFIKSVSKKKLGKDRILKYMARSNLELQEEVLQMSLESPED